MQLVNRDIIYFREQLLHWARVHGRDFRWRRTRDPYCILISEIMLRRTRAVQVEPVYSEFLRSYPDPESLSAAHPHDIKRSMQPLGLAWRTENMVALAADLKTRFNHRVPSAEEELKSLPGSGDYVTAAVMCFAYGKATPLIDTNVVRVLGRIFGLNIAGEARRRKEIKRAAARCVETQRPRDYHYALLDFAAKVCKARSPNCPSCPFENKCNYGSKQKQK